MADPMQQAMGPVKERYVARLHERIALLARLQAQLHSGPLGAEDATALHEQAHQLAGNGAIFGFVDISNAGRALEQLLLAQGAHASVQRALAALLQACHAAVIDSAS